MMFPKKKWSQPDTSKTMKVECPEELIQNAYEEYLDYKHIDRIRIPDKLFSWIMLNTPPWFQAWFNGMHGGRPDDTLIVPIGKGIALAFQIELKTQDNKKRAVGRLHGKQNRHEEEWIVCRSIDEAMVETEKFLKKCEEIKKYFASCV